MMLLTSACYLLPALVWAIVAQQSWRLVAEHRPRSRLFRLVPLLTTVAAALYLSMAVLALLPVDLVVTAPWPVRVLFLVNHLAIVVGVVLGWHVVCHLPLPETRPARSWLAFQYAAAALVALLGAVGYLSSGFTEARAQRLMLIRNAYALGILGLMLHGVVRSARRGAWRPGGLGDMRSPDVALLAFGLVGASGWVVFAVVPGPLRLGETWVAVYDMLVGLGLVAPLAVRALGEVVRRTLLAVAMAVGAGAVCLGALTVHRLAPAALHPLVFVTAILALLAVVVPGQTAVRAAIDGVLFRRTHRRYEELQAFFHTLSPELGTTECCRRALAELTRVLQLRGAAILLPDRTSLAHGAIAIDTLRETWGQDAASALPLHTMGGYLLRELPEARREALVQADVSVVVPVLSPRARRGTLFIATGFLSVALDDDAPLLEAFADRLALVLDGAELLARAVAVERSLAHAEKLAAIGELAARFAHDIRNPVTAARSLAQQLSREPDSPFNAEHARLVVGELDRVEQQVRALLRFAQRESYTFEPVDLVELTQRTVDELAWRVSRAGVELTVDAREPVVTRADREKLRHVIVNLIENALDALAAAPAPRRLALRLAGANGSATLRVSDSGAGVPAEALPRLFEPFFSLKPGGTGLGLSIARRTVEAHGGDIAAECAPGTGMTFRVTLPALQHASAR
jgi:signal transduction histidine kinase